MSNQPELERLKAEMDAEYAAAREAARATRAAWEAWAAAWRAWAAEGEK